MHPLGFPLHILTFQRNIKGLTISRKDILVDNTPYREDQAGSGTFEVEACQLIEKLSCLRSSLSVYPAIHLNLPR